LLALYNSIDIARSAKEIDQCVRGDTSIAHRRAASGSAATVRAEPLIPIQDIIPSRSIPVATMTLIAANALLFAGERWTNPAGPAATMFAALRPLFFHPGTLAFVIGAFYLWLFGDNVEDQLGRARFTTLYVVSGLTAAVAQSMIGLDWRSIQVGASGAIGGVLGAYFLLYPHSRVLTLVPFPLALHEVPALLFLLFWYMFQVLMLASVQAGRSPAHIAPALVAHATAFVTGALLCLVLRRREWRDP
jgi:membrane associated rhomboid family serine protease